MRGLIKKITGSCWNILINFNSQQKFLAVFVNAHMVATLILHNFAL